MKLNSRTILVALLLWIPVVGLLFATIPEKKVASVVAGSGFLILPLLILFAEFFAKEEKSKIVIFFTTVFFLFSALPIFLLRVLNWSQDFSELSIIGIPAEFMHRTANFLYLLMVIAVGIEIYRERKAKSHRK